MPFLDRMKKLYMNRFPIHLLPFSQSVYKIATNHVSGKLFFFKKFDWRPENYFLKFCSENMSVYLFDIQLRVPNIYLKRVSNFILLVNFYFHYNNWYQIGIRVQTLFPRLPSWYISNYRLWNFIISFLFHRIPEPIPRWFQDFKNLSIEDSERSVILSLFYISTLSSS